MGRLAFDLGNIYRACKIYLPNGSPLFWALFAGPDHAKRFASVTAEEFAAAQTAIETAIAPLQAANMSCSDAKLIASEFQFAADLLSHACRRGCYLLDRASQKPELLLSSVKQLTAEHRRIWMARNREGGLTDSAARLEQAELAYQ
jgi:hypothetical protein